MKEIRLHKKKDLSLRRRHPWIFSGAISTETDTFSNGDLVVVKDSRGEFLAVGHFQHATIAVRVLSFQNIEINQDFFNQKIQEAWETRMQLNLLNDSNNVFRLIHGEGDNLPGLIIDYYDRVAVIQAHSIGMYRQLEHIVVALQYALGDNLKAVYNKSSETLPKGFESADGYLFGNADVPLVVIEHNVKINIDWVTGQKTGFFIDQRENRSLLEKYARGKKVLNTFCYSGGFSLTALRAGAATVHSLDSSKKAIALTDANVELNDYQDRHLSIVADTMDYIKKLPEDYDVIILDPPAFAKSRAKRHKAVQGYKRLNAAAIRQIKPGGIVFTFSCSQAVDKSLFTNTIIAAAIEEGRNIRILEQLHQPADHPINAFHPEGEYLKGLVIRVD